VSSVAVRGTVVARGAVTGVSDELLLSLLGLDLTVQSVARPWQRDL